MSAIRFVTSSLSVSPAPGLTGVLVGGLITSWLIARLSFKQRQSSDVLRLETHPPADSEGTRS